MWRETAGYADQHSGAIVSFGQRMGNDYRAGANSTDFLVPASYHAAVGRLNAMAENEILELHIDDGESLRTIPFGLRAEGHEILVSEPAANGVRLLVRKRSLLP